MMPGIGHDLPYTVFLPKLNKSTKPNPAFSSIRRQGSQENNKSDSKKPDRLEKQSQMSMTRCPKLDHLTSPESTSLVTKMAGTLAT